MSDSPPKLFAGDDLPIMGSTPSWLKGRKNPPVSISPLSPLPYYALPPREFISVPPQAKYLIVSPPEEEPVLPGHVPRTRGSKPKTKPPSIKVVPASRPIALPTAHTPAPISAMFSGKGNDAHGQGGRSAPGTPHSSDPSPYIDPGMSRGLPYALGLQAFPTRAERPWRHGG
ncbi:hypothetical protein B0H19DRAFT_1070220 [Mycena capillaripes]|nr:hypothetical protein B0H19DRAFT_1070220 [Mycena capillaripes]